MILIVLEVITIETCLQQIKMLSTSSRELFSRVMMNRLSIHINFEMLCLQSGKQNIHIYNDIVA